MGFKIQSFSSPNYLYYFPISLSLILCFLLISSSSAKPLPHRSPLRRPSLPAGAHHRTTLHGGVPTTPFTANKLQMEINNNNKKKKITAGFKSNNGNNNNKPTAFSVMLPKGFVPPSGSSPCHNENPESVAFYCHLSATNP